MAAIFMSSLIGLGVIDHDRRAEKSAAHRQYVADTFLRGAVSTAVHAGYEPLRILGAAVSQYQAQQVAEAEAARQAQAAQLATQRDAAAQVEATPAPAPAAPQAAPEAAPTTYSGSATDDYEAYIRQIFPQYGQDPAAGIRVMYCESSGDPRADNGVCKGLFQFNPGTWASTPEAGNSIWDPYAQIRATAWMWAHGRRNEWSCQ